jgi:predicted type IV restriction endonuclease
MGVLSSSSEADFLLVRTGSIWYEILIEKGNSSPSRTTDVVQALEHNFTIKGIWSPFSRSASKKGR